MTLKSYRSEFEIDLTQENFELYKAKIRNSKVEYLIYKLKLKIVKVIKILHMLEIFKILEILKIIKVLKALKIIKDLISIEH